MFSSQIRILAANLMLWLCDATSGHAASFDCSQAITETEIAICNDPELSALDERMSKAYLAARTSIEGEDFKQRQLQWITNRNNCVSEIECIKNYYEEILLELQNFDYEDLIADARGKQQVCKRLRNDGLASGEDATLLSAHTNYNKCIEDIIVDLMTETTSAQRNALEKEIEQLRISYQSIIYQIMNDRKECEPFCGSMFKLIPPHHYGNLLDDIMADILVSLYN